MKTKNLIILSLLFLIIVLGSYVVSNEQKKNGIVETTTTLRGNTYRDENNGFEFNIPSVGEVINILPHQTSMEEEAIFQSTSFTVTISNESKYVETVSGASAYRYFYNQKDNSWYRYLETYMGSNDLGGESIFTKEPVEKVCDNKIIINSQPFYRSINGDEGFVLYGFSALLSNGKFVVFSTGSDINDHKKIAEVLKTFKTLDQVKLINTADCK